MDIVQSLFDTNFNHSLEIFDCLMHCRSQDETFQLPRATGEFTKQYVDGSMLRSLGEINKFLIGGRPCYIQEMSRILQACGFPASNLYYVQA